MTRNNSFPQAEWSTLRRHPERGTVNRDEVLAVLREAYVCHIAWGEQSGPVVIPMGFGLWGEELVLHGSKSSRLLNDLAAGHRVSVAVTLLDGLVLARSGFYSSVNFRSVVLFGRCRPVESSDEKKRALEAFVDHVVPGRSDVVRPMTDKEIEGTRVLAFQIEEATAKVRQGPPKEPERDRDYPVWAGVVPIETCVGEPEAAPDLDLGLQPPSAVKRRQEAQFCSGVAEQTSHTDK